MNCKDLEFDIAIGRNRYDTRWRNERWTWGKLLKKLQNTARTPETVREYAKASKQHRDEIKDIGGFVGGYISGGHRKKGAVLHRQVLTLDIDFGKPSTREDIEMDADFAYALYSTHSSTPESPRYRLIIPMKREVNAEEYEAVGRRIAARIGIDQFDDTTYQAERLMYWPSTPSNGEYVFDNGEGDALDPDAVLAEYTDWHDCSQWEVSSRVTKLVQRAMKKQGDPLEKPGAVGRFCRAYTIQEVIETYLDDVYSPTTDDNRYTYAAGSTAGGLVVYDDKFAYSHHGTDPAGGQLCNAFDLVRVHKYGLMDEEAREDTPINRKPSYLEMERVAMADERVRRAIAEEQAEKLQNDFGGVAAFFDEEETAETDGKEEDWRVKLETDKHGTPKSTAANIILILENEKGLKGNILRNDLLHADIIRKSLPWRKISAGTKDRWSDDDDTNLLVMLETVYSITGRQRVLDVRNTIATRHRFHPVRDYLEELQWDGTERVESFFIDTLGAPDTRLTREVTRKVFAAAVARVYEPGCKFDYITVLQGREGIGKSTVLRFLGGPWFTDSITNLDGKEGKEQIQGYWIEELSELVGIKRNEVESIKSFLSCQTDSFRPAYGRVRVEYPRQCIFFATTNEGEFLKGDTGNRRFWVLACDAGGTLSPWDLDERFRDQLWAEAVEIYRAGEKLCLEPEDEDEMRAIQKAYNEDVNDARIGMIAEFVDKDLPAEWRAMSTPERQVYIGDEAQQEVRGQWKRDRVCAIEVLVELFHERIDDKNRYKVKDINSLLDRLPGWKKAETPVRFPQPYGMQRGYLRISATTGEPMDNEAHFEVEDDAL